MIMEVLPPPLPPLVDILEEDSPPPPPMRATSTIAMQLNRLVRQESLIASLDPTWFSVPSSSYQRQHATDADLPPPPADDRDETDSLFVTTSHKRSRRDFEVCVYGATAGETSGSDTDEDEDDDDDDDDDNIDYPDESEDSSVSIDDDHLPSTTDDDTDIDMDSNNYDVDSDDEDNGRPPRLRWVFKTCQVCFVEGKAAMRPQQDGREDMLTINELFVLKQFINNRPRSRRDDDSLAGNIVVRSSCGKSEHEFCLNCIRSLVTTHLDATLHNGGGYVRCPASTAFDVCQNANGQPYVLALPSLQHVVNDVELVHIWRTSDRITASKTVQHIATDYFNHYLWSGGKDVCDHLPALVPQDRVDPAKALAQFCEIATATPNVFVKCKECDTVLCKTSECNALSHCGTEVCNICGYSDLLIPPSHWKTSSRAGDHHHNDNEQQQPPVPGEDALPSIRYNGDGGVAGQIPLPEKCPRYDDDSFWVNQCGFRCVEGDCYDNDRICTVPQHQAGIQRVTEARRQFQLRGLIRSLPVPMQTYIFANLEPPLRQRYGYLFESCVK